MAQCKRYIKAILVVILFQKIKKISAPKKIAFYYSLFKLYKLNQKQEKDGMLNLAIF